MGCTYGLNSNDPSTRMIHTLRKVAGNSAGCKQQVYSTNTKLQMQMMSRSRGARSPMGERVGEWMRPVRCKCELMRVMVPGVEP